MVTFSQVTQTARARRPARAALLLSLLLSGCASVTTPPSEESSGLTTERTIAAADEAARSGNLPAALTLYGRALSEAPTADLWFKAGMAHFLLDNAREAAYAFSKCIELDPQNADAQEQIGLLYVAKRDSDSARTHLERAIALDTTRWQSHNGLGVLADLEADYARAMVHYQSALEAKSDSPMLYNNMGYSRYLAGDLVGAAGDFMWALKLDSRYEAARRNLGLVYARGGAYQDAVKTLTPLIGEPAAYNDVGYIALLGEDYAAAEELLASAMQRSPSFNEAAARNLTLVRERRQDPHAVPQDVPHVD